MEIILGKTAGFCYGVERAINGAIEQLEKNKKNVTCLGEIVHNKSVIKKLEESGIKFVKEINEIKDGVTIIRAHGTSKENYEKLKNNNIDIIDLTCPNVLKTHEIAQEYSDKGYFIILIGIKEHPEAIGTLSFCSKAVVIQENEDIENIIKEIKSKNIEKILIMAQTTYNSKKFDDLSEIIKKKLDNKEIQIKKTICGATEIRQKETIEISKKVDCMIIVGDKKSSNTNKLYDISKQNCKKVIFVQNENELLIEEFKGDEVIGIMAGASTPKQDIEKILKKLRENK